MPGAGQIGLLAVALTGRPLVCVDLNPVACDFARRNADAAGLAHLVEVREARLEEAVAADERFALVIADPPWVPRAETGRFPEDPLVAIDGGEDGMEVARACARIAGRHLLPGGSAIMQLGTLEQAARISDGLPDVGLIAGEVRIGERGVLLHAADPTVADDGGATRAESATGARRGGRPGAAPCGCRRTRAGPERGSGRPR